MKKDYEKEEKQEPDTPEEEVNTPPSQEDLDPAQEDLTQTKDQLLRLIAEFDNYKKRTQKEQVSSYNNGVGNTVKSFLDIFDNLDRAASTKDSTPEDLQKGVDLILNQFSATLEKLKIEVIDPLNQPFDPNLHNAVMHIQDENFGQNTICEVFQKGYQIGDTVIRFAMVKVAN